MKPCEFRKASENPDFASEPTVNEAAGFKTHRLFITESNSKLKYLIDAGADVSIIPATFKHKMTHADDIWPSRTFFEFGPTQAIPFPIYHRRCDANNFGC